MNSKSKFTRFSEENMSWLSNSLQLAGELLESVDQKAHVAEIATLKQSIEDLTHTKDQAWTHAASGEAQLEQRVASLLAELTEASAAHVQLKKEYADSKQSMYARQCALEATNAELTTQVATLQHASTEPTVSSQTKNRPLQEAQDMLASTKKQLHEECRKAMHQAQEISKLTADMTALQAMLVHKEASHHAAVLSLQKELHEARTARPSAGTAPVLTTTTAAAAAVPDGQMQAMTRRLLEKQEQLDAVRSRYTTLEVRFNDLKAAKDAQDKHKHNSLATLLYRSFNRHAYERTADINYMEYRNVDITPDAVQPWQSIHTEDHSGRWSQGDKANICNWFSLMHHYETEVPIEEWHVTPGPSARPYVYLNTCNHMIGETDNNPQLPKHEWVNYQFQQGDAYDALAWVKDHIPTKMNLYSICCCCWARNGGGCCDRHVIVGSKAHHKLVSATPSSSDKTHYVLHEDDPDNVVVPAPKAVKTLKQKRGF
ncbi:hypothetical protein B5M09_006000 [Aphanomyces astaci]|uniref:Uncharacterized protein n=1 Tax=Aphanomyces astaci TaxID=112090 RepID=A0A3R7ZB93_APHAT|nr:hypothetical protein B5M09_006000 [Aphanomyces astaci]